MAASEPSLDVTPEILEALRGGTTLLLATASATAVPCAARLSYVEDGGALLVRLPDGSAAARNVAENPLVGFAIDGLQGRGRCEPATDAELPGGEGGSLFRIVPAAFGESQAPEERHREIVYGVFRELPIREVLELAAQMQTIDFEPGAVIVQQGDEPTSFFIVVAGEAEAVREYDGEARVVGPLNPGDFFGEVAVLRDLRRTATIRAVTRTTLLAMEGDAFRELVARSFGTTENFERIIRERMYSLVAGT
jgi:hypothetical protein